MYNNKNAAETLNRFCNALDKCGISYEKNNSESAVLCRFRGDDLVLDMHIVFDGESDLMRVSSPMPYIVPTERYGDFVVLVTEVNSNIFDGSFDYDIDSGTVVFRTACSFFDAKLDENTMIHVLKTACERVDKYNDKFLAYLNGELSIEEFPEQ